MTQETVISSMICGPGEKGTRITSFTTLECGARVLPRRTRRRRRWLGQGGGRSAGKDVPEGELLDLEDIRGEGRAETSR
jgi:hypothetical protein